MSEQEQNQNQNLPPDAAEIPQEYRPNPEDLEQLYPTRVNEGMDALAEEAAKHDESIGEHNERIVSLETQLAEMAEKLAETNQKLAETNEENASLKREITHLSDDTREPVAPNFEENEPTAPEAQATQEEQNGADNPADSPPAPADATPDQPEPPTRPPVPPREMPRSPSEPSPEAQANDQEKPATQRDLERIAKTVGRVPDDPEVVKLLLKEKRDQYVRRKDNVESTQARGDVVQKGASQDLATAKRELEEAMYVYDPKFADMQSKTERLKAQLDRTDIHDMAARSRIKQEIRRLKDVGPEEGHEKPRRDEADELTARLDDITGSLEGSEILATYELHKNEYPSEPIADRRRDDTLTWAGKPEYNEEGKYIGDPNVLEPKPPAVSEDGGENGDGNDELPVPPVEQEPIVDDATPGEDGNDGPPTDSEPEPEVPIHEPQPTDAGEGSGEEPPATETWEMPPAPTERVEVEPINFGDYPEQVARRKNLDGGDLEALEREGTRMQAEIADNILGRVNNFRFENPNATPEEVSQFAMTCYVEAESQLSGFVIDAIDGKGYTDPATGETHGKSRLRRFGAWMDRNGKKLKKGMLIVGGAGAVVLTGGIALGAIAPAFALGTGTIIGAAKGATTGLAMSRHGSKESATREIDVANGEGFQGEFEQLSPYDQESYNAISGYLIEQYNDAANINHDMNVKKSRRAAIIGAVAGAIGGSLHFNSPVTEHSQHTVRIRGTQEISVPNHPPAGFEGHTIEPGELTGRVLNNDLHSLNIRGFDFVNPDGSTNLDEVVRVGKMFDIDQRHIDAILDGNTDSFAGANSLTSGGGDIGVFTKAIINGKDWGSHTEKVAAIFTDQVPEVTHRLVGNVPATIGGYFTSSLLGDAAARQAAESVRLQQSNEVADEEEA